MMKEVKDKNKLPNLKIASMKRAFILSREHIEIAALLAVTVAYQRVHAKRLSNPSDASDGLFAVTCPDIAICIIIRFAVIGCIA